MKTTEVPILIVGGGAAGTMLSLELARHGVEARTIDRLSEPGETSRALVVHARTAELLERIDERLIAPYLERAIHNKGYVLHFVDKVMCCISWTAMASAAKSVRGSILRS
jgi:2-polyprenyl-6-methoxyphenol hydroxylase-like FAD-dependent oxidoreductase